MASGKIASLLLLLFYSFSSIDAQGCLCLAVDNTASMQSEIQVLQDQLPEIIRRRQRQGTTPDIYTLVPFGDPTLGQLASFPSDFLFMLALAALSASGGGDCPDLALTGLESAIDNCNSDCSVFAITDADAKDRFLLEDLKDLIVTKRVQVNFILTGTCEGTVDPIYHQIADFSLGLVVQVSKAQFASMMPFIDLAIDHHQRHSLLAVNQVPLPHASRFVFDVIENTTVTEIYLSGLLPFATVIPDGSNTPLTFKSTIVELPRFKILTLEDVEPNSYLLEVRSGGPTSIRIHGYAENGLRGPAGAMGDFDIRVSFDFNGRRVSQPPLVATRLIIESVGDYHPAEIHQVELTTFQNTVIDAKVLERFPENSTTWRSGMFVIPRGNYYARVLGRTFNGMDFGIYAFPAFESVAEPRIATDGDPLFTVQLNDKLSMCYAVHGDPNKVYNLISSPSINVNSYFINWPIKPELNFHGKIGILACNRECLVANVETCELFVNGKLYGDTVYQSSCVEVVRDNDKMTIKTLQGYEPVEMLIQCHSIDGAKCLKFQVLNPEGLEELNVKPHGLMGQFYHQDYNYTLVPTAEQTLYKLNIRGKEIPAIWDHKTWNRAKMPCFYVGDSQGNGVIDGRYTDYEVKECSSDAMKQWEGLPLDHCQLCSTEVKGEFPLEYDNEL